MLNLHDPMSDIRTRFREVWKRYFIGDLDGAQLYMEESVRMYLEVASYQHEFEEIDKLQLLLMEEKHRWEDVQQVAALVAEQLEGNADCVIKSKPSSMNTVQPVTDVVLDTAREPVAPAAVASAGGLDLANMIDVMLSEER